MYHEELPLTSNHSTTKITVRHERTHLNTSSDYEIPTYLDAENSRVIYAIYLMCALNRAKGIEHQSGGIDKKMREFSGQQKMTEEVE